MRLPEAFDEFHDKIVLGTLSEGRINSAWGRLHDYLTEKFALADRFVYIHGSYANDTAVKPADASGEYDLDIVCVNVDDATSGSDAIGQMTDILAEDADLAERIEPNESGRPCVRLQYAADPEGFGFHVDIVPARGNDPTATIDIPMRGQDDWRPSAPYAYTEWCQQQPEQFRRVIRLLKRWRDEHGDGSIASIVLQVLTADHLDADATSDAEAITGTLSNMRALVAEHPDVPPETPNPVLPDENLAERWEDEDYVKFRAELDEAVRLAEAALQATDEQESHDGWVKLFGDDFPPTPGDIPARGGASPPPPPPDYPDDRQQAPTDERYG